MKMKLSKRYLLMRRIIQFLGVLALIGTLILVVWFYKLGILNNSNELKNFVQIHKYWGPLIFILVQIFQVVFPVIPGGVTTVAGFLIFGPWLGFLYNYVGIMVGSVILFWLVQIYGRKFILLFVNEKTFYKYEAKLETKGFENFFILCMVSPISPADVVVMITGLTNMSLKRFTIILLITKPISIVGYGYLWMFGGDLVRVFLH